MNLGVLVYIDNRKENIEEFYWLYKSMIFSGLFDRAHLIAVCHPAVISQLPADDRIRIASSEPHADRHEEWKGYGYINSIANLCEPEVLRICKDYRFILKTDCDTFVTKALVEFEPTGLCFGFGAYAYEERVREKLSECSRRWGFPHSGLHNVGASVLGPAEFVSNFVLAQMDYCEKLLSEEFSDFQGEWPGWCKNVLTMYAGELALRRTYPQQCSLGLLDHLPYSSRPFGGDVLHIHAWQTDQYWSKMHYRAGSYSDIRLKDIDRQTLGGYCHWLAAADVNEVKRVANISA